MVTGYYVTVMMFDVRFVVSVCAGAANSCKCRIMIGSRKYFATINIQLTRSVFAVVFTFFFSLSLEIFPFVTHNDS